MTTNRILRLSNFPKFSDFKLKPYQITALSTRFFKVNRQSKQERSQNLERDKAKRPFVEGLKNYKWIQPLNSQDNPSETSMTKNRFIQNYAMVASGTQRATGFVLVIGWTSAALLSLPGLPITTLPIVIEAIKTVPIIQATIKGGVAFCFGTHGTQNVWNASNQVFNFVSGHCKCCLVCT